MPVWICLFHWRNIKKSIKNISIDDEIDTDKLAAELVQMGYERCGMVNEAGQFAIRGGIIDIF